MNVLSRKISPLKLLVAAVASFTVAFVADFIWFGLMQSISGDKLDVEREYAAHTPQYASAFGVASEILLILAGALLLAAIVLQILKMGRAMFKDIFTAESGKLLAFVGAGLLVVGLVCLVLPLFWIYSAAGNTNTNGLGPAQALNNASHVLFVIGTIVLVGGLGLYFAVRARKSKS